MMIIQFCTALSPFILYLFLVYLGLNSRFTSSSRRLTFHGIWRSFLVTFTLSAPVDIPHSPAPGQFSPFVLLVCCPRAHSRLIPVTTPLVPRAYCGCAGPSQSRFLCTCLCLSIHLILVFPVLLSLLLFPCNAAASSAHLRRTRCSCNTLLISASLSVSSTLCT